MTQKRKCTGEEELESTIVWKNWRTKNGIKNSHPLLHPSFFPFAFFPFSQLILCLAPYHWSSPSQLDTLRISSLEKFSVTLILCRSLLSFFSFASSPLSSPISLDTNISDAICKFFKDFQSHPYHQTERSMVHGFTTYGQLNLIVWVVIDVLLLLPSVLSFCNSNSSKRFKLFGAGCAGYYWCSIEGY